MRRASRRERLLIALGLVVLIGLALGFFVVVPMRDSSRALAREEQSLEAKIEEALRMYQQLPAATEEAKQLRASETAAFRPGAEDMTPQVVREISQLTTDLGLALTSVIPGEPESLESATRYPITFHVESGLAPIVRLLYELEQRPRQLWVEGVAISPGPRGGSQFLAVVNIATYGLAPEEKGTDEKA